MLWTIAFGHVPQVPGQVTVYLTKILRLLWREAQEMHEGNKAFPDSGKLECRRVPGFHSVVIQQ